MRRGIALVLPLLRGIAIASVLLLGFWLVYRTPLPAQTSCPPAVPPGQVVEADGCLEWRPLPVPRFGTNPDGSTWSLSDLKPGSVLREMDLRGADWRGVQVPGVTFRRCDFLGANPAGAKLQGCRFPGTILANADLRGADLRGADLTGAALYLRITSGQCAHGNLHAKVQAPVGRADSLARGFPPTAARTAPAPPPRARRIPPPTAPLPSPSPAPALPKHVAPVRRLAGQR